tara:strand:+ start:29 stop:1072 length:1044 start_codon:yes stop_codon:yes gene_type:complete
LKIQDREIGIQHKPFVIAEIGINHGGDYDKAIRMVDDAYEAGAECVKFQCHVIDDEMTSDAKKIIPMNASESIYDIMNNCALSYDEECSIKFYTEQLGMIYLSTPFSRKAADRLESMDVAAYKIGSGECNNYPLVEHIAKFKKPIILSTGMNNLESIAPSVNLFRKYRIPYALLHCTSLYPTPYDKVRLGAIHELKSAFTDAVLGLSDHSLGNYTCYASVALGSSILEKHFTSDKEWPGPDIEISIDPKELKELIDGSSFIHSALEGSKDILEEEQPTIDFAYASVVSIKDIKNGDMLTEKNIWVKRPGTGEILAKDYKFLLGKKVNNNIDNDHQLSWQDIKQSDCD